MKQYFTSDWHIGHKAILTFCPRPFSTIEEMAAGLITRYNATVTDSDVCYFLGDMGFGKGSLLKDVISQLKGKKILIIGNHDGSVTSMYTAGFDAVLYGARVKVGGTMVTLTHCPLRGITREDQANMKGTVEGEHWHGESRMKQYSIGWEPNTVHLHGHIHSPNRGYSTREQGRQFDVGVDANDYTPVSASTIEKWIARMHQYMGDE